MSHAFNDWNVVPEHSVRIYEALKVKGVPTQIFFHQGGHGGPPPMRLMNRWFTRDPFGVQNGVEKDPHAWIVREADDRSKPTPYDDYPNPAASPVTFHLVAGAPEQGTLVTTVPAKQGVETLVDNFSFSGTVLAQAEWTDHRLIYVTPKLTAPVHVSGTPRFKIKLASSRPAANLSVWLVSLPWNNGRRVKITDNIITRGWADPQNYRSLTESEPLVPGRYYPVAFDLEPDDQIIPAGQQIGLMIFSSDRDFTLWPTPGTKLTVDLDATSLTLPVVGGAGAMAKSLQAKGAEHSVISGGATKDTAAPALDYGFRTGVIARSRATPGSIILVSERHRGTEDESEFAVKGPSDTILHQCLMQMNRRIHHCGAYLFLMHLRASVTP